MQNLILSEIVVLFMLSIVVVLICHRFRLPAIVGFLLTGALCGPSALGLVPNMEAVNIMADVGVVFLLFTIGMEMSGKELMRLKKPLLVGGSAQVLLTMGAVMLLVALWTGAARAVVYGCLIALSSTAIVLSLLQQKGQTESRHGRLCLAILIFQDLAIVPMMLAQPLLHGQFDASFSHILAAATKSAAVLGGVLLFGRFALPRLMLGVVRTRSRELLLLTTLGLCLSVALATSAVGLSLSLGAFLAGLMLAESDYSLNVLENITPFKDVFTSIFFMSVGMLLDMRFFLAHIMLILALAAVIMALKIVAAYAAVRLLGQPSRTAVLTAFSLAQVGEFSFVLAGSAVSLELMDANAYQLFLAASIVTMSLTPVLMAVAPAAARRCPQRGPLREEADMGEESSALRDHLIIVGFGVGGKSLARGARESGIPYVILEMNPDTVAHYRGQEPIHHGDASFPLVLSHLGVTRARVLAIVVSDPASVRGIIANARKLNPALHIVVRSRFLGEAAALRALGANDIISEEFESSIEVFARVLNHYLVPRQTIDSFISRIREENYDMLRHMDTPGAGLGELRENLPDLQLAAYEVEEGSPIAGKSLAQSTLRRAHGATAAGLRRGRTTMAPLTPETCLLPGDVVYLLASQDGLTGAAALFRVAEGITEKSTEDQTQA